MLSEMHPWLLSGISEGLPGFSETRPWLLSGIIDGLPGLSETRPWLLFQDSVVAYQAFAAYEKLLRKNDLDLSVTVVDLRGNRHNHHIRPQHAELQTARPVVSK
jgi:hypothetical protein